MLPIGSFGKQNKVNNAFKCQNPYALKIKSYKKKRLPKWHYRKLFGNLGTLYGIFIFLSTKCIYLLLLLIFFLFQIKNLWFSSQRRREGVVGDANGSISKIMYCTCFLCSSQKVNCYFQNKLALAKGANCV